MLKSKKNIVICIIAVLFLLSFLFGVIIRLLHVYQSLTSGCLYYICLILIIAFTVKFIEKQSLENIGVDFQKIIKKVILGIGIFAILSLFQIAYVLYGIKLNFVHLGLPQTLIRTIFFICFVGFAEELVFRGYLLERLNELLKSKIYAVLLSSALFGLWHYPTNYYFGQVIFAFFFGIVLSIIKFRTKGNVIISLAIGHGLYNSLIFWVGYFIK